MNIAIDYDGCITANYQHYFQLAKDFVKSGHKIYIITAAKQDRAFKISQELLDLHFPYTLVSIRPSDFKSTYKNIGEYKKKLLKEFDIDLWFDNEVKIYEQAGINFADLKTAIIRV